MYRTVITRRNSDGTFDEIGTNNRYLDHRKFQSPASARRVKIPEHYKGVIRFEIYLGDSITNGTLIETNYTYR